jgi:hypothetical protein
MPYHNESKAGWSNADHIPAYIIEHQIRISENRFLQGHANESGPII